MHAELARRADLVGERLPDYLSMLLTAAADRVQPRPERYGPYAEAWESTPPYALDRW